MDIHNNLNEFHIQLEDILHAYISLVNELVHTHTYIAIVKFIYSIVI